MNIKAIAASLPRLAAVLGVNTIPALGWLRETWSAEVAMLLYYLETVAVILLVGGMVRLIVPVVDERGLSIAGERNRLARSYVFFMLVFAAGIGLFLGLALWRLLGVPIPWRSVGVAMAVIVVLQLVAYGWEAYRLRPLDITDAERLVNRDMGRITILHLGVLFGMFLAAARLEWFVWPFIIMKTTVDVAGLVAQMRRQWREANEADAQ